MRRLLLIVLAACTPDITSGSYFCGPDSVCPEDQTCNGPDNTCVLTASAKPFACADKSEHEPDDAPAQAFALPALTCASPAFIENGCLHAADPADWISFTSPTGCTSIAITARLEFPTGFEAAGLTLATGDGTMIAAAMPCDAVDPGDDAVCLTQTLDAATAYAVEIAPTGEGTCDGECNFNRYTLTMTVGLP